MPDDLAKLVGCWRIISAGVTWTDTGERIEPFGHSPVGYMMLSPSGRIMFFFARSDRLPADNNDDRAALLRSMMAYTGIVRLDGRGQFTTTVDLSWDADFSGDQVRLFTLNGNRLSIRTPEQTQPQFGNRKLIADIDWERVD
jgi:hypothetical protein